MTEPSRRAPAHARPIRYREATPQDGLALWRLRRLRMQDDTMSPFFYLSLLQRRLHTCVVADRAGDVLGYLLARRDRNGDAVRVLDVAVDPACSASEVTAGLLSRLVKLPEHDGAAFIEAEGDAHAAVRTMLGRLSPFAPSTDEGNDACNAGGAFRGALE